MSPAPAITPAPARRSRALVGAYAALLLAVGLLLGGAELQHYLARGGRHAWEPLLWELSSVLCTGVLALAVYRWHRHALTGGRWRLLALHLAGALAFSLAHVAGMFGLRFAVYALMGVRYDAGGPLEVLAYELGKDLVSYLFIVGICHGIVLFVAEQRRRDELSALRAELAEARLSRLAEQIQPHFLFNTLNLISSVMYEDVARADRILCDLAQLLRQALGAQEAGSHSLAQELTLVEPYLAIMRERFGERLCVEIDASAEARRCLVPALLLISPVENAVKHDVALTRGSVTVTVRAWLEAGRLRLRIENSGTAPERVERDGGLGMANTRERLRTLYGAATAVRLEAGADGGTVLDIELPAEPQREAA